MTPLIVICAVVAVMAVLHVGLRRWSLREQARVAAMQRASIQSPSLAMPEPDEDEERSAARLDRLLDEIASASGRAGRQGRAL